MAVNFQEALGQRRGYAVFTQKEMEIADRAKNRVRRFWLPPERGAKIVFLDDEPPIIEEHQVRIGGKWTQFTCLRIVEQECPLCSEMNDIPYTVGFYTIIDTTEWTDKKGMSHRNEVKVLPAKFKTLQQLRMFSSKKSGLFGCVYEVYRTSRDAYSTGDVWDFAGKLNEEQIKKLNADAAPVDYSEYLKPKEASELMKILKRSAEESIAEDFDVDEEIKF